MKQRMNHGMKKIIGILLSFAMVLGFMPGMTETIYADIDKTITGLGTGAIANPTNGNTSGLTGWTGSYVYYGKYNSKPLKYRVLSKSTTDFGGNTILLDYDSTIIEKEHRTSTTYSWSSSNIKSWLNGNDFLNSTNVFTTVERDSIVASTKSKESSSDGAGLDGMNYQPLTGEKVFLLDAKEVTNSSYGYLSKNFNHVIFNDGNFNTPTRKKMLDGNGKDWSLRSPVPNMRNDAGYVSTTGVIGNGNATYGVSPAFNIDLSSVIFSSLISGTAGSTGAVYKLTIKDTAMGITPGTVTKSGTTVTVPYTITGTNAGNATQVSVLLTDREYSAGTAATSGYTYLKLSGGVSGSGTFTLPESYADMTCGTDYYAYILAEDVNGANETDYASEPVSITIPSHVHDFSYEAGTGDAANTVTATCSADGCDLADNKVTLTIVAPTRTTYNDQNSASATLTGLSGFNAATGLSIAASSIKYEGRGDTAYEESSTAPTDAGTYTAKITAGEATASVDYSIAKADPIADAPTGLTATYGQTLNDVTISNPSGNTAGTWAWVNDSTTSVGSVGDHTFAANFTPSDTTNYNSKENVDITITVNKAGNPATVTQSASVMRGGHTVDLASCVAMRGAAGDVSYAIDGEDKGCGLDGSVLTSGDDTGEVKVNVSIGADDNYEALSATPITVTITDKDTQTITCDDSITATYGDRNVGISATTDGDGDISYAVKSGDDCIDVDANGDITIKKAGTAVVTVTAEETSTYAEAVKDVPVTINKVVAPDSGTITDDQKPTKNEDLTYTGQSQSLVTAPTGSLPEGYTIEYSMDGENWSTDIPTATDAGNYSVQVRYNGGDNYESFAGEAIQVRIEQAEPDYTVPDNLTAEVGQTLADIGLPAGWTWNDNPATSVGGYGENTFTATYTPDDTTNYKTVTMDLTVTVRKTASSITTPPAVISDLSYNGSEQALVTAGSGVTGGTLVYALGNESGPTGSYSASIPSVANAGTYYVWYKVAGDDDHEDTDPGSLSVTIAKLPVTVSGITVTDKEYDGTDTANLDYTSVSYTGVLSGDTLTVTATGTYDNASVGENKSVAISGLSLGGAAAANYVLAESGQQTSATGKITQKAVTVTAKDQTVELNESITNGVGQATLTGAVSGHTLKTVTLTSSGTGSVTQNGTITASNASIQDPDGHDVTSNYNISYTAGKLTVTKVKAKVTTAPRAISGLIYDGREYDLVTAGAASGGTLVYSLGNTLMPTTAASTWQSTVPSTAAAGDYCVWYKVEPDSDHEGTDPVRIDVSISPKTVTVSGITADNKSYDGTASATVTVELDGKIGADDVRGEASATFADPAVGDGKTVTATGFSLKGDDAGNYTLADTPDKTTTANISKRRITITASDQSVTVGGSISKGTSKVSVTSGAIASGQSISEITLSSSSTASATSSGTITPSGAVIKAGSEDVTANYDITYRDGTLTVTKKSSASSGGSSSSSSGSSSGSSGSGSSGSGSSSGGGSSNTSGGVNYDELSAKLSSAVSTIYAQKATKGAAGVTQQIVTWDKGNAIPYSAMKTLQDNPNITLVFKTTYGGMNYTFTIPGSIARAYPLIPWYGPLYLLAHYGQFAVATPVGGGTPMPVAANLTTVPGTTGTYTVVRGDTLIKIASRFKTTVKKLVENNGIKNQNLIFPGQVLKY